jgi:hypothetical protein
VRGGEEVAIWLHLSDVVCAKNLPGLLEIAEKTRDENAQAGVSIATPLK